MPQSTWHSRWLAWLDAVQTASRTYDFSDVDPTLEKLHHWFTVGLTPAQAVAEIRALQAAQHKGDKTHD